MMMTLFRCTYYCYVFNLLMCQSILGSLKDVSWQVGMKQGRQCDFEEAALCGAVNDVGSDNADWDWVDGNTGGKIIFIFVIFLGYSSMPV